MVNKPSLNGDNGRDTSGRFAKGNPGGPGNPHVRRTAALRSLLLEAVTDDDMRDVVGKLIELAKAGELPAIRELLDRVLGKPKSTVETLDAEFTDAELDQELEDAVSQIATIRKTPAA